MCQGPVNFFNSKINSIGGYIKKDIKNAKINILSIRISLFINSYEDLVLKL